MTRQYTITQVSKMDNSRELNGWQGKISIKTKAIQELNAYSHSVMMMTMKMLLNLLHLIFVWTLLQLFLMKVHRYPLLSAGRGSGPGPPDAAGPHGPRPGHGRAIHPVQGVALPHHQEGGGQAPVADCHRQRLASQV